MSNQPPTIAQALTWATDTLAQASPTPRLDAELLLTHTLGISRVRVLTEPHTVLDQSAYERFRHLVERRVDLEPVAYLIGHREFYGLDFEVTPAVLVPRPETELLVELALTWVRQRMLDKLRVADIGTGSGCIAVAFAVNYRQAHIIGVDRSPEALEVAGRNVRRHGVADRVELREGNLLAPLTEPIDLLISNPPYTVLREIDENVRLHEPHLALDGGPDGLDLYRRLIADAPTKLIQGGALLLEIGATQGAAVSSLAAVQFPNADIRIYQDLAGLDRVVAAYLPL